MDLEKKWCVYILECKDGSYYTGITNDIDKRMVTHASGKGSKYVKRRGFRHLIATSLCENKSDAAKAEYFIKQLPKNEKLKWFSNN
jgi:putative endonuclease